MMKPIVVAFALIFASCLAAAQPSVYRCGPDGREYSATPCADGKSVPVADPRNAEQQRQARDATRRESRLADKLGAERREREAAAAKQKAAGITSATAAASAASQPAKKPKKKKKDMPKEPATYSAPTR